MELNGYFLIGLSLAIPFHSWFFNQCKLEWAHKFFTIALLLAAAMFPVYLPTT